MDLFLHAAFWGLFCVLFSITVLVVLAFHHALTQGEGFFGTIGVVGACFVWIAVMFFLAPWFFPSQQWAYRFHNEVTPESLFPLREYSIVEQPHDCEFLTAPLGSKHCHYEPVIFLESGVPHAPLSRLNRATLLELFDGPESRRTVTWNRVED